MQDFLSTPYGLAAFIVFDVAVVLVIAAVNYKWFFKRFLDVVCSALALVITSPVQLAVLIAEKVHNARENEFQSIVVCEYYIGKKGKPVRLHEYAYQNSITGETSSFGRKIKPFARLVRLADVFAGRLSFIGPLPLKLYNEYLISDEDYARFKVRPGIINPLVVRGVNETRNYEKMFRADKIYVKKHNLFSDTHVFFVWLLCALRGSKENRIGVARNIEYAQELLNEEKITQEDYAAALEEEQKILRRENKRKKFLSEMGNRR